MRSFLSLMFSVIFVAGCSLIQKEDASIKSVDESIAKYEQRKKEISIEVDRISQSCWNKTKTKSEKLWEKTQDNSVIITTRDMIVHGDDWNTCVENKVKNEIRKLFNKDDAEKSIEYLEMAEKGTSNLYYNFYNLNKYCSPHCGTMNYYRNSNDLDNYLKMILIDMIILNETNGLGFYSD